MDRGKRKKERKGKEKKGWTISSQPQQNTTRNAQRTTHIGLGKEKKKNRRKEHEKWIRVKSTGDKRREDK